MAKLSSRARFEAAARAAAKVLTDEALNNCATTLEIYLSHGKKAGFHRSPSPGPFTALMLAPALFSDGTSKPVNRRQFLLARGSRAR